MAATLPAISSDGMLMKQGHLSSGVPSGNSLSPHGGQVTTITLTKKRSQGRKERELEQKQKELRAQQPYLNQLMTAQYRNTYKHTLCLDILQEGFHKSFAELFWLIKQQNEEREKAGPESTLWNQRLLENEQEKLDTLKLHLTEAESALRQDNFTAVYQCQFKLALYFQEKGDKWLADHFFASCLKTSSNVHGDEGKMAAQSHCNVGMSLEESADYHRAAENFELFYNLSKDKTEWVSEDDGKTYFFQSCTHLMRIYTTIAEEMKQGKDLQTYLMFLKKAYDMAKEGGDRKLEGEASYRLGVAYEKNGESATALVHLNAYLDTCRSMGDNSGQGKACEAIAKSYDSQGKVEESIKYLEMFVEVAEKSQDNKAISQACSDLGAMFNSLGRYEQAVDYFNKSYNIARSMNDTETISSSRVLFGVAAAHKMLFHFAGHVELGTRPCMERLIEWKDNRGDEFDKPIPDPVQNVDTKAERDSPKPEETTSEETTEENENKDTEETHTTNDEEPAEND